MIEVYFEIVILKKKVVGQIFFALVKKKIYHPLSKFTTYFFCMVNAVCASDEIAMSSLFTSKYTTIYRSILRQIEVYLTL